MAQVLSGTAELFMRSSGGIAWWAHVGGFVAGGALTPVLRRSKDCYRAYHADEGIMGSTRRVGEGYVEGISRIPG
jgi:membrane associated rhomboid family serine protease